MSTTPPNPLAQYNGLRLNEIYVKRGADFASGVAITGDSRTDALHWPVLQGRPVINWGVGGSTPYWLREHLEILLDSYTFRPEAIIVNCGINLWPLYLADPLDDEWVDRQQHFEDMLAYLKTRIRRVGAMTIVPFAAQFTQVPGGDGLAAAPQINQINASIRLACTAQGVPCQDIAPLYTDLATGVTKPGLLLDGIHYAETLKTLLRSDYEALAATLFAADPL